MMELQESTAEEPKVESSEGLGYVSHKGFVTKMGFRTGRWQKRYLVLKENLLEYYKNDTTTTPSRVIRICEDSECVGIDANAKRAVDAVGFPTPSITIGKPHCIQLQVTKKDYTTRTFYFQCADDAERDQWVSHIQTNQRIYSQTEKGKREAAENRAKRKLVNNTKKVQYMVENVKDGISKKIHNLQLQEELDPMDIIVKMRNGTAGLVLTIVHPDSLAAKNKLTVDDVIIKFEDFEVVPNLDGKQVLAEFAARKQKSLQEKGAFVLRVYNVRTGRERTVEIFSTDPNPRMGMNAVYGQLKNRPSDAPASDEPPTLAFTEVEGEGEET